MNLEAIFIFVGIVIISSSIIFVGWINSPVSAAGGGARRSDVNGVMIEG